MQQQQQQQRGERRGERERERDGGQGFGGGDPGERIMEEDVSQNVFSAWYNVGGQLSGLEDWDLVPADIDGIYEKFLLPIMRKNRDVRVLAYWDNKINIARVAASDATASFGTDTYNQTTRPSLLWSRAEDEIVIGQRPQGLTDMYNLVKGFPTHPDETKWITELEGLLTTPPAVAAGGTSAPAPQ
jgi:hypothetical protein